MVVNTRLALAAGALALGATLALPGPALAQHQGDGFLFRQPAGSFSIRLGFAHPNAGGDPYSFFTNELTLSRASFNALSLAGDVAVRAGDRLDLVFSLGWEGSRAPSEMRHWLDPNNQPIRQTTTLQRVPLTVSLRYFVLPPGRSVGRFAWVPSSYAPYVGAGAGLMYYSLHQFFFFFDLAYSVIFTDSYESSDWSATAHVFTGVEMPLGARFVLNAEGRYTWAKGTLGTDFSNFGNIDLSGFAVTVGAGVRF
jgi:hypothetical protein